MKTLTENEMYDLLADYAFDRISEEDKIKFEANLSNFPEVEKELAQVQKVVYRLDAMKIDEHLSKKTRNIPYLVADKLERRRQKSFHFYKLFRIAVPAFTMIFIVGFSFWMFNNHEISNPTKVNKIPPKTQVFTEADAYMIIDSNAVSTGISELSEELAENHLNNQTTVIDADDSLLETVSYQMMGDKLITDVSYDEDFCLYNSLNSDYYSILNEIDEIDEVQFQTFLKEIKNEKANY